MTMMEIRADFASWLLSILAVHDSDFVVDVTERKELELGKNRKTWISVTGDPIKYCVIEDMGQGAFAGAIGRDAAGNAICEIGFRFKVKVFLEKDYITSQDKFEAIVYNESTDASPGILSSIRTGRTRIVSGESYFIGNPQGDAFTSIIRGTWDFGTLGGNPELTHYLEFEATLIH